MAKKLKRQSDEKSQSERFTETARRVEVDESQIGFERAFRKIVPTKHPSKRPSNERKK